MNFTARIKYAHNYGRSAHYKPNYILNVSIDIPLRPSQLMSDRPVSGEFTFSPSQLKKKLKLEVPSARTTREGDSRKLSNLGDTQQTIPVGNLHKKKAAKSLLGSSSTSQKASKKNRIQLKSEAVSPHRKRMGGKNSNKFISSNKTIKNSKILRKLVSESEDNIIRYTNESSEMRRVVVAEATQSYPRDLQTPPFLSGSEIDDYNLVSGIREFERTALEKKQHLNYLYLKEKILVLASVKKIQRAWRNYKTKKLIRSYSNDISLKFTNKMKGLQSLNSLESKGILTVRSCGVGGNTFKKPLKGSASHRSPEQQKLDESKEDENLSSARVKFEIEEIKKWEELIKQIREGKKVQQILEKSFKRKQELEREIRENKPQKSYNFFKNKEEATQHKRQTQHKKQTQQIPLHTPNKNIFNTIESNLEEASHKGREQSEEQSCIENEFDETPDRGLDDSAEEGGTTLRRRKKLQFFENEIRKIDNEGSESNLSQSEIYQNKMDSSSSLSSLDREKESEFEENQKLKKKLQLISKLNLMEPSQVVCDYEPSSSSSENEPIITRRPAKEFSTAIQRLNRNLGTAISNDQDKLDTFRQSTLEKDKEIQSPHEILKDFPELSGIKCLIRSPVPNFIQRVQSLNEGDKQELERKLEEQLIFQLLLEFSDSDKVVLRMKDLYERKKHTMESNKPEGICTNLESIKDYLENFVAFIFEQHPDAILKGLMRPCGLSSHEFLKSMRPGTITEHQPPQTVISLSSFNEHWSYASEQIYFDIKHPDAEREEERVRYLKNITKIYFRAIFDGFNQCLEPYRYLGRRGRPYAWENNLAERIYHQLNSLSEAKPYIRLAYRKLSQISVVHCGVHFEDKKHSIPEPMIRQIQEQKINTLLQIEMEDEEYRWQLPSCASDVLYRLSLLIMDRLIVEACGQICHAGEASCCESARG